MASGGFAAGSAGQGFVGFDGLKEFQSALRKVDRDLPKITSKIHQQYARDVKADAKSIAARMPGGRHFARMIGSSGNQRFAQIKYAAGKHPASMGWARGSKRYQQFLAWSGNRWEAGFGDFGKRTYAISPAIDRAIPRILAEYEKKVLRAVSAAYPGKGL